MALEMDASGKGTGAAGKGGVDDDGGRNEEQHGVGRGKRRVESRKTLKGGAPQHCRGGAPGRAERRRPGGGGGGDT